VLRLPGTSLAASAPNFTPVGQITETLSSPRCKNISLSRLVETSLETAPSRPKEGRFAIVTDAGRDAVDADVLLTNSA
jgi:hypothetical protein